MADQSIEKQRQDANETMWRHIEKDQLGMLQAGAHTQAQPMTAMCEPEQGRLWFFTRDDTDLAKAITGEATAQFIYMSHDRKVQAALRGPIVRDFDPQRRDAFWNPVVGAWYPEGKDDPHLTMLRMDVTEADVWTSTGNPIRFAFEIGKANLSTKTPDLGGHQTIQDPRARP